MLSNTIFMYDPLVVDKKLILETFEFYQVSELSLIQGGEIPEHVQWCNELTYAVSGNAKIFSDGEITEISSGQIHYIKKGVKHKIVAGNDSNFRYICIGFLIKEDHNEAKELLEILKDKNSFIVRDTYKIKPLFDLMVDECYINDENTKKMLDLYIKQILFSVKRAVCGKAVLDKRTSSSTSNLAVYNTVKYIDRHYLHITNVKQISEALSYSEFYISHLFKEKMDMSMKEYLMQKKMTAAAEILPKNELTVGGVSEYLGFSSVHTFSHAFKRYFGMSPTEYKSKF